MSEQLYKYLWRALCSKLLPSSFIQRIAFNIHLRKNAKKRVNCVWSIGLPMPYGPLLPEFRSTLDSATSSPSLLNMGSVLLGQWQLGESNTPPPFWKKNCPTKDDIWHFLDLRSMLTDSGHCAIHYNSQVREGEPKNINNHL